MTHTAGRDLQQRGSPEHLPLAEDERVGQSKKRETHPEGHSTPINTQQQRGREGSALRATPTNRLRKRILPCSGGGFGVPRLGSHSIPDHHTGFIINVLILEMQQQASPGKMTCPRGSQSF